MTEKRQKPRRRLPVEVLTTEEFIALVSACSTAPTGQRNRALLAILYGSGLRLAEALGLYPKDLDFELGSITVLHGKGDRRRTVGIDPDCLDLVAPWYGVRKLRGFGPLVPLLCTLQGRRVSGSYVRALLPRLAERAGITKRVHPHGLRHSLSAQLAAEGVPLNVIQQQLGHSSVSTTSRYLDHIQPTQVLNTMRRRHPLKHSPAGIESEA